MNKKRKKKKKRDAPRKYKIASRRKSKAYPSLQYLVRLVILAVTFLQSTSVSCSKDVNYSLGVGQKTAINGWRPGNPPIMFEYDR